MAVNKPLAFAKAECANYAVRGQCLGILPDSLAPGDGPVKAVRQARCRLGLAPPERCPYFEQVVLPLADWPSPKRQPKLQAWRLGAREEYWAAFSGKASRKCKDCRRPTAGIRRYCERCAGRRRNKARREAQRRYRHKGLKVIKTAAQLVPA